MATRNTTPTQPSSHPAAVAVVNIGDAILMQRGERVLLNSDLSALYDVPTKRLNEQVKRNLARFPADFMFRLTTEKVAELNRSQLATGSQRHRDPRFPPYAFTEHGAIMAATILSSERSVQMSIHVVRAFVHLRELIASNAELAKQIKLVETKVKRKFATHDAMLTGILKTIRELMAPPEPKKRPIGFTELQETKKS